ncbi:Reverse transcriptase (RNA-dependent DNA polymerase) [Popillia japonica]|uniref:Reverse transcriptase (RNA-dependent DNA polymerase) n=1 Tax=Popillia japonica TaxID=7064 RepID=A0AAW1MHG5_POPJA
MKTRLLSFLERTKLLTDAQHGYRSERSTLTAAISLVENILNARDDDQSAKLVLYDLSKAFDTVPHDILLHKLNFYGIRGTAWKRCNPTCKNGNKRYYGIVYTRQRIT